jgi:ATP-dependent DNA helicase DinG
MALGNWAVIDIETTGVNASTDEIIDLGFLQFENTKLVRSFSSLVRPENSISSFITKLTGISNHQLQKAPPWSVVKADLMSLESHNFIAHNASFEESFLMRYFEQISHQSDLVKFQDSLLYLALLFPDKNTLSLEHFISFFKIAEKEEHRGLADSIDLLKVLLISTYLTHRDQELRFKLSSVFQDFPDDFFYKRFFMLSAIELEDIASQLDFSLMEVLKKLEFSKEFNTSNDVKLNSFEKNFSGPNLKNILRDEEQIIKVLPNYKHRSTQEQMALRVGQAFKNKVHALIQAPTGTGKTMGYLLPSFLFSLNQKETCLIATGTKTLQVQALNKDIPEIKMLLDSENEIKVVKLVGSANHLCELMFREKLQQRPIISTFDEVFSNAFFEMIFFYNSRVPYDKKLTREEIPFVLKRLNAEISQMDSSVAVDYRACAGQACPLSVQCSYIQGLREAKDSKIILGNHALMLNWPKSLPKPMYVIIDEAHRLEQEATRAFSIEIHQNGLEIFLKSFSQGMGALIYLLSVSEEFNYKDVIENLRDQTQLSLKILRDHVESLPQMIESWFKKLPTFNPAYSNELAFPKKDDLKDPLSAAILNHFESICFIFNSLNDLYQPFISKWQIKDFKNEPQKLKAWAVLEANLGLLEKNANYFRHYLESSADWCTFISFEETYGYAIISSPVDVGKKIHDELLNTSSSVIFTSATLGNANGDSGIKSIEWMTGYFYLENDKRFKSGLFLDAVFDYKNKSKVYLCDDGKNISDPMFVSDMLEKINPLILKLGGKTLLLFSSRLRFNMASDILIQYFDGKIPVYVQGLGKRVVDDFKKESSAILVGMESFGEGIDIPGEKLSFIVIDKIPDLRQDLITRKRRDFFDFKFGNEFNDYFLAHRARSLHQKFGRLLRSENDHGAILLIDNRVKRWKGNTLKTFQKLMEPYVIRPSSIVQACKEIADYFKV